MSATSMTPADQPAEGQNPSIPCCPDLIRDDHCDVIKFSRVLTYPTSVLAGNRKVSVEVILRFKFTRCTLGLTLGDPVYSTTLLPGEKVRLATTDRRSRFSFDSETKLSYRSEQVSEEQYYMTAFQKYMSDASASQSGNASSSESGHWDFHGDASGSIGFLSLSADASTNASGNHNSHSVSDYLNQQSAHVQSAASQSVSATHKAHSISVGEVSTRTHIQGESEDHFEASSREFSNPNKCHAVTFLFYRLNKKQIVKFELESIERRVVDPAAPVGGVLEAPKRALPLALVPQDIPATSAVRKVSAVTGNTVSATLDTSAIAYLNPLAPKLLAGDDSHAGTPLDTDFRKKALKEVDAQLMESRLLDASGKVSPVLQQSIAYEAQFSLPTAGVIVKGCLDDCDICEPEAKERLQLKNDLLRKKIELLEKSQRYRCCPVDNDEEA